MANANSVYSGQMVAQDVTSNETRLVKCDGTGNLAANVLTLPAIPTGANVIGIVNTQTSFADVTLTTGTLTVTTASTPVSTLGIYKEGQLFLNVTSATGTTPSLVASVQGSTDGTNWFNLVTFTAATGVTTQNLPITNFGSRLRVNSVITGTTPSFSFSLTATFKS